MVAKTHTDIHRYTYNLGENNLTNGTRERKKKQQQRTRFIHECQNIDASFSDSRIFLISLERFYSNTSLQFCIFQRVLFHVVILPLVMVNKDEYVA